MKIALILFAAFASVQARAWPYDGYSDYGYSGYSSGSSDEIISLDTNEQDALNVSLRIAAREGQGRNFDDALNRGAQINAADEDGATALMATASYCHPNLTRELLARHADVNRRNMHGETALMLAIDQSCTAVVRLLLKEPSLNLKLTDHLGQDALALAIQAATPVVEGPPIVILQLVQARLALLRTHHRHGRRHAPL